MSDFAINNVLSPSLNIAASKSVKDTPEKIRDAATQFEGLMIGEMLKTMHEDSGEGWLGSGDDETASTAMGMADDYFGRSLAASGGLGLASMISKGLEKRSAAESKSAAENTVDPNS